MAISKTPALTQTELQTTHASTQTSTQTEDLNNEIPKHPNKLNSLVIDPPPSLFDLVTTKLPPPLPPSASFSSTSRSVSPLKLPPESPSCRVKESTSLFRRHSLSTPESRLLSPALTPRAEELSRSVSPLNEAENVATNLTFIGIVHNARNELVPNVTYTDDALEIISEFQTNGTPIDVPRLFSLIQKARTCAGNALEIFQETLLLGKSGAGQLKLVKQPFQIEELERSITDTASPAAAKKGLALKFSYNGFSSTDWLIGDSGKINQALTNLVLNGIKFTEEGSVEVSIDKLGPLFRFQVKDTGIGMSPKEQAELFKPFSQVGSAAKKAEGVGIGLLNSAMLIHMMNQKTPPIRLESIETQGTIFAFEIPLELLSPQDLQPTSTTSDLESTSTATSSTTAVAETTPAPFFDMSVAIVDDGEGNRNYLQRLLKKLGINAHQITHFENADDLLATLGISATGALPSKLQPPSATPGATASELLTQKIPDLIFFDEQMPGTPGTTAAAIVRNFLEQHPNNHGVSLVCTGANLLEDEENRFDGHFQKGGRIEDLRTILNKAQTKKF